MIPAERVSSVSGSMRINLPSSGKSVKREITTSDCVDTFTRLIPFVGRAETFPPPGLSASTEFSFWPTAEAPRRRTAKAKLQSFTEITSNPEAL